VQDNFTAEILVAFAQLNEEIASTTDPEDVDGLGTEVDITASWAASKNVSIYGGLGFLFSSDVLDEAAAYVVNGSDNDTDSAMMFYLGTAVTF
jgi:hypothetical protein